jgi:hypothetical protein
MGAVAWAVGAGLTWSIMRRGPIRLRREPRNSFGRRSVVVSRLARSSPIGSYNSQIRLSHFGACRFLAARLYVGLSLRRVGHSISLQLRCTLLSPAVPNARSEQIPLSQAPGILFA